jgi:ABC-type sugar transport system ATPase subunit
MPLIIDKISKRFGNKWALRDVSFTVEDGSVIGIFGPSGSGKSALLKTIAGAVKTNGGAISLNGQDITAIKAKDRGTSLHAGHQEKGFRQLFGDLAVSSSTGEMQFDRFENVFKGSAKVILLDEPFSEMDTAQREICFAAIRKAAKARDRIVIFASSDFGQIISLTDEVAFLANGSIIQSGTPQEIYDEPVSVAAAQLTGDNNLIAARRVSSTDAELPEFHTIYGGHRLFAQSTAKVRLGSINQNITLAIRPEQVSMSMGASFPEDNLLKGKVTKIHFRGPTSIIEFDAAGLTLETRVFKVVGLKIGDECMLGLPPHRILILKD